MGVIFLLFIIYSALNIVYIVLFNSYAVSASKQYNDIEMRMPLMSQVTFMCRQAFFENDTHYLLTQEGSMRELPEYRNWLLRVEETVLDFEKTGPVFIFPGYMRKVKAYNGDQFCTELKPLLNSSDNCDTYDSGFFKMGLRSSQFRFVTFWQGIAQRFLKETGRSSTSVLDTYRYDSDSTSSSKKRE